MHPGFPANLGNGYAQQGTDKVPRYWRRRRGPRGHHGSFRISHDNFSSSSSSSHAHQYPVEWASSPRWKDFDDAYFQSYSQIGIHEEMIKVSIIRSGTMPACFSLLTTSAMIP